MLYLKWSNRINEENYDYQVHLDAQNCPDNVQIQTAQSKDYSPKYNDIDEYTYLVGAKYRDMYVKLKTTVTQRIVLVMETMKLKIKFMWQRVKPYMSLRIG